MSGVVVCVDPRAADQGARVLEGGGNAFDAAIATAFVQMVVMPFMCGVGGMASAQLWHQASRRHVIVDGLIRAGSLVSDGMWAAGYVGEGELGGFSLYSDPSRDVGYQSIGVPGTVAALSEVHERFGSLPWRELLRPAADLARTGFRFQPVTERDSVGPSQYEPDPATRVQTTPDCARLYYRDSIDVPAEGVTVRNPDYADTIDRLAEHGAADLYHGELAVVIASDLSANGSFVTRDDLREYRTTTYAPVWVGYRELEVWTNGPPGGGPVLAESLNVLGGLDLAALEHSGAQHIAYLASTFQLVNQDRRAFLGDPEHVGREPAQAMVSDERAIAVRAAVVSGGIGEVPPPHESPDTTHVTVVDGEGNAAAITHSLGAHSGVITPGLGFVYNNGMSRFDPRPGHPASMAPGKARVHSMAPTMVFEKAGPYLVLGAPGGNAIPTALVQTLSNVVDFGMTAVEAVSATRVHAEGSKIWCEARLRRGVVDELGDRGFEVVQSQQSYSDNIGFAQLVIVGEDGELDGGSDPRSEASGVASSR